MRQFYPESARHARSFGAEESERRPEMFRAIDADTHIFESPPVWDFLDEAMYTAYEEWEDLPYLATYVGESHLIVGSDWGHHGGRGREGDPSGQPEVFANMRSREDVAGSLVAKMLSDNPRRFYGLPAASR